MQNYPSLFTKFISRILEVSKKVMEQKHWMFCQTFRWKRCKPCNQLTLVCFKTRITVTKKNAPVSFTALHKDWVDSGLLVLKKWNFQINRSGLVSCRETYSYEKRCNALFLRIQILNCLLHLIFNLYCSL